MSTVEKTAFYVYFIFNTMAIIVELFIVIT